MADFRVIVEDLGTGDRQTMELYLGDYLLYLGDYLVVPFGDCYLAHTQVRGSTNILTIKGHNPTGQAREVPNA